MTPVILSAANDLLMAGLEQQAAESAESAEYHGLKSWNSNASIVAMSTNPSAQHVVVVTPWDSVDSVDSAATL